MIGLWSNITTLILKIYLFLIGEFCTVGLNPKHYETTSMHPGGFQRSLGLWCVCVTACLAGDSGARASKLWRRWLANSQNPFRRRSMRYSTNRSSGGIFHSLCRTSFTIFFVMDALSGLGKELSIPDGVMMMMMMIVGSLKRELYEKRQREIRL